MSTKLAPHNIEAEQALLGAILVNNKALDRVSDFLKPTHFFEPTHRRIFELAGELIRNGKLADSITLQNSLPESITLQNTLPDGVDISGNKYLARLTAEATTIRNAEDYGRTVYDLAIQRQAIAMREDNTGEQTTTLESARASTYEMEAIEWMWPDRFARGKVALLVGLPDEGKGQLLSYITAQVTTGGEWPCKEGHAPLGNVILLTAEDDPSDTVVPRLVAAGADRKRVEIVKMVRTNNGTRMFSLVTDLELLRKKIIEVGDVKVVQIDPITAYLGHGKIDSFRTTDVRAILAPLVDLAAELGVAIIAVMHFNKRTDVTNALLRISDSLAFGATARHVYAAVDDAENKRKLLVRAKNNLAPNNNKTLAYHFGSRAVGHDSKTGKEIWAPYILWEST
jgi:hypothetical protein